MLSFMSISLIGNSKGLNTKSKKLQKAQLLFKPQNIEKMKERSIELLNAAVADELQAVHQYMYFHFHCDDQGYDLLANLFKRTAIQEMVHVEKLAERILFLKGDVNMELAEEVKKVKNVKEMLEMAAHMEETSAQEYNEWANECAKNADAVSKKLFEELVAEEERHFNQFDDEMENLKKFGDNYLALQSIERSKNIGGGGTV
jgi:bacterioferritin